MPTEAELKGYTKCPRCDMRRLKVTGTRETGTTQECVSCGYLMAWKPRPPVTKETKEAWHEEATRYNFARS